MCFVVFFKIIRSDVSVFSSVSKMNLYSIIDRIVFLGVGELKRLLF